MTGTEGTHQGGADGAMPEQAPAAPGRSFFGRAEGAKSPKEALQPEATPPPPPNKPKKKRGGLLSNISGFLSFLLVLMVASVVGYGYLLKELRTPGPLPTDKAVVISPGTDGVDIVDQLVGEGVISSGPIFTMALRFSGQSSKSLKAGEYMFKQNASLQEVIDTLASGKAILHNVTIPEGWTSQMAVDRLMETDVLAGEVRDIPPEGALFPDTYRVTKGAQRDVIIRQMLDASKKIVAEVWAKRAPDLPLKSPYEMVTLASIVEKETAKADERARVAAVYINRLNKHIRLQSDPTIVYGLVGGKGTLGHAILKSELDKVTPYNTYQVDGLPPGPIANPGRAALEAVANPSRTKELYFVADGTGGHVFAETFDQHQKNVVRWRQIEKDAKDKLAPEALPAPPPAKPGQQGLNIDDAAPLLADTSLDPDVIKKAADALAEKLQKAQGPAKNAYGALGKPIQFALTPGPEVVESAIEPDVAAGGPAETYPMSPGMQADLKTRAAKFGAAQSTDPTPSASAYVAREPLPNGKTRILDASEGTALDPLLNKSFDLNSSKTIPKFK